LKEKFEEDLSIKKQYFKLWKFNKQTKETIKI